MKRGFLMLGFMLTVLVVGYLSFSKWGIRHETLSLDDSKRDRVIGVDLAVRRDAEIKSNAGITPLPVVLISQGNTVKNTEYSFIANVFAARGYLVASIQHDMPNDTPLMTVDGSLYVGRLKVYERAERNIFYVLDELKKREPSADFEHLTLVGHSNGGDISMFFAQQHPDMVAKLITLDNLRVPFIDAARTQILSFRSKDWKPDTGVVPTDEEAKKAGIDIIHTDAQHTQMSDRGPDALKEKIGATIDKFLGKDISSALAPVDTKGKKLPIDPRAMGP